MELTQIKEWNSRLKKPFKKVSFQEEGHLYTIEGDNRPIKSVSSLLKYLYEDFDTDTIAPRWANERNLELQDVLDAWEGEGTISTTHGSKVHLIGEDYVRWKFFQECDKPKIIDKQSLGAVQFIEDLPSNLIPIATELVMYSPDYWYTGTCDGILLNTDNNKLILYDYKGLPIETPILTSKGWKTMGTLNLEDKVFDNKGNMVNINHISDIKNKKCLKIKFDNNEEIISDFEHRWLVYNGQKGREKEVVLTTQEIFEFYRDKKSKRQGKPMHSCDFFKIKNSEPLNIEETQLPIDPYVFGVWLGDGHSIDAKVTQMNEKVWDEIENRGYLIGKDVSQGGAGKSQTRTIFGLQTELRKLNLLKNKHLPDIFLLSSLTQRLDILRGLMDTDGYYNQARKRYVISTTKLNQVNFSVEILASLGIKPTVLSCTKVCNGKKIQGWDICFTTTKFNPFLCRNESIEIKTNNLHKYRRIVSIEEVESTPTICIEVDSPSHTFLFGKSLIVTHNTNKALTDTYKKDSLFHVDPRYDLIQDNFGKYSAQFSFYQILLEDMGFEVQARVLVWLNEDKKKKRLYKTFKTKSITSDLRKFLETKQHLEYLK